MQGEQSTRYKCMSHDGRQCAVQGEDEGEGEAELETETETERDHHHHQLSEDACRPWSLVD